MLWTIESHTHGLCFSKCREIYWQSNYNFIIIIKNEEDFRKNICLFCTWARILWYKVPACTQSLDGHRLHTQGLILQKHCWEKLMMGMHTSVLREGRSVVLACSIDWGKHQGFLTLVTVAVLINSNDFLFCAS